MHVVKYWELAAAVMNNQEEIIRLLIEKGARLDVQDVVCLLNG